MKSEKEIMEISGNLTRTGFTIVKTKIMVVDNPKTYRFVHIISNFNTTIHKDSLMEVVGRESINAIRYTTYCELEDEDAAVTLVRDKLNVEFNKIKESFDMLRDQFDRGCKTHIGQEDRNIRFDKKFQL